MNRSLVCLVPYSSQSGTIPRDSNPRRLETRQVGASLHVPTTQRHHRRNEPTERHKSAGKREGKKRKERIKEKRRGRRSKKWTAEKGWLLTCLILLPHFVSSADVFMTSLIQTTGHKMAAFKVGFCDFQILIFVNRQDEKAKTNCYTGCD